MIETILQSLAEHSVVGLVALYAIWRMSIVMVALADALVLIASVRAEQSKETAHYEKPYGELPRQN